VSEEFKDFVFTLDALDSIIRVEDTETWYTALSDIPLQYDIDTIARMGGFLSQCIHESGGFTVLEENLNYSKDGLLKVFPKYFKDSATAEMYARKPEKIANRVYAKRMSNGPEESGDGWMFRGRGIIQITGRENYTLCSQFMFSDDTLVKSPDLLLDPYYAIHSACWFWQKNNINELADRQDVVAMTKRINGGVIGLAERIHLYNNVIETLQG
jgi:putative chitinase